MIALKSKGVRAYLLTPKVSERYVDLSAFQIIYMTPELFDGLKGRTKLEEIKDRICLVAIDECHCVTQWGVDFRKTFRKLASIKTFLAGVPIVCLTATATDYCQRDVSVTLGLENPLVVRAELNRPNLAFEVFHQGCSFVSDVKKYLTMFGSGTAIIYVLRRKEANQYSQELRDEGIESQPYHAKMTTKNRQKVVKSFAEGTLRVVVATIAFGMGIDRADVRVVIHYGSPKNIESYYQESGRAGRDGGPGKCIIFWTERDFQFHRFWLRTSVNRITPEYYEHCENLIKDMENFLKSSNCRRVEILRYFNVSMSGLSIHESCCDNCVRHLHSVVPLHQMYEDIDKNGLLDLSVDARIVLRLVQAYKGRCYRISLRLLMGEIPSTADRNHPLELFAIGKLKPEAWWSMVFESLQESKMIKKHVEIQQIPVAPVVNDDGNANDARQLFIVRGDEFFKLTQHGKKFLLRKTKTLRVAPTKEIFPLLKKTRLEVFIENGEMKSKPRTPPTEVKVIRDKKTETSKDLFNFEVSSSLRKSSKKLKTEDIVNDGAGCSGWTLEPDTSQTNKEESDGENEDNENLEMMKEWLSQRKEPMKVDFDELLVFLENYDEQPAEDEKTDQRMSIEVDVLISNVGEVSSMENRATNSNFGDKRSSTAEIDKEDEVPTKVHRAS